MASGCRPQRWRWGSPRIPPCSLPPQDHDPFAQPGYGSTKTAPRFAVDVSLFTADEVADLEVRVWLSQSPRGHFELEINGIVVP